ALDSARSRIAARDGLEVDTLAAVPRAPEWADPAAGEDAIDLLNAAFATDGALIRVRAGVDAGTVAIVSIGTGEGVSHALRHVLRLEEGATLNLLETQLGGGDNVTTTVCRVRLDDDATLRRVQAELKDDAAIHFANLHAELGARARLADLTLIRGGRFHRQQDFVDLAGPQAEAQVDSAYLLRGRQHADTHLVVNHLVPHGTSRETFKCVMDERARGAFQGRIHVAPGAQKSDGRMAAHGLLLGEAAEFDAKPELEIYADDVVCAHGATAGALDEEQMFYLRARGVPEREARALLIAAFVAETFDAVEDEEVRAALRSLARAWLAGEE
ncbi:MAG TPA: Fe-S cluster assembly protein SufD, partial [Thermopetrobacter sp.]|nr:Fe-S cluster assembly protein SufD [Thermopetrobacter sp.]